MVCGAGKRCGGRIGWLIVVGRSVVVTSDARRAGYLRRYSSRGGWRTDDIQAFSKNGALGRYGALE